jgi:hypothetical protein
LVENVLKLVPIHSVQSISRCHLVSESSHRILQTEGQNIPEVWRRAGHFDMRKFVTTDVHEFASKYGVT